MSGAHQPSFAVIRALRDGRDVLIVVDQALDADRLAAVFPLLLTLTLPINDPDDRGLCDDLESERLADLEDLLLAEWESCDHVYAGRVTGHGVRSVLLYTPASSGLAAALRARAATIGDGAKRIQVKQRLDPGWSEYRSMAGGAGSANWR
jgi:hypothetical protein